MSDDSSNWWGRNAVLAAAVTGLLALAGTVTVAIITTSRSSGGQGPGPASSSAQESPVARDSSVPDSGPVTTPTSPPSSPASTSTPPGPTVVWRRDHLRLPYGSGLDLDAAAPTLTDNGEFVVSIGNSPAFPVILLSGPAGSLGGAPVSYPACAEAITADTISSGYASHPGDTFCVQSASRTRLAGVTIIAWDPRGASGYGVADVAVVVWPRA